jgi:ribosomal protein S18 acetylase RimI-like enzyme
MRAEFQIRRAVRADASEIARIHVAATRSVYRGIYTDAYLESLSVEDRARAWAAERKGHLAIDDPDLAVFVAIADERMVGFADIGAAPSPDFPRHAALYAVYLDPDHIGRGIGQALWRSCVDHAKKRGFDGISAELLSRNVQARAFYERMGAHPLPATEMLIETGGTKEKVITYRWPAR